MKGSSEWRSGWIPLTFSWGSSCRRLCSKYRELQEVCSMQTAPAWRESSAIQLLLTLILHLESVEEGKLDTPPPIAPKSIPIPAERLAVRWPLNWSCCIDEIGRKQRFQIFLQDKVFQKNAFAIDGRLGAIITAALLKSSIVIHHCLMLKKWNYVKWNTCSDCNTSCKTGYWESLLHEFPN